MHNACFLKHFRAPNIIVKYDGKTNPNVWLEDYRHVQVSSYFASLLAWACSFIVMQISTH
jgi:hypothetical protein